MTEQLLNRQTIIQLDTSSLEDLRVDFSVIKTIGSKPNKASIDLYNPSPADGILSRARDRELRIRLLAGYDTPSLIFEGNPTAGGVSYERSGPDKILTLEAQDGLNAYQDTHVNITLGTATSFQEVVDKMADQIGLPRGTIRIPNDQQITQGTTLVGSVADIFDRVARSINADWSIQDGVLQMIPSDETSGRSGPEFSKERGNLIQVDRRDDGIKARTLLHGDLRPGDRFKVKTDDIDGVYKAERIEYHGSRWSNDFYLEIEATESPT